MPDPMSLDLAYPTTTMHLVELFTATRPRLVALRDTAKTMAQRRGSEIVSNDVYAAALALLAATRNIVARQRGARSFLQLLNPPDWTTLLTKLELAVVALAAFRSNFSGYDARYGAVVWRDEIWLDFHLHGDGSSSGVNDLHES